MNKLRTLWLPVFFVIWPAAAITAASSDRTYTLPCEIGAFSPSGDGSTVWIECVELPKPGKAPPPYFYQRKSMAYAIDIASGRLTELAHSVGITGVTGAPFGDKAVVVLPDEGDIDKPILYERSSKIAELPREANYVYWSADASKIFFFAGSTDDQSSLYNIVGIVKADGLGSSQARLSVPTELMYICPQTGHVFTGSVGVDRAGHLQADGADEYDAELHFVGHSTRIPPGNFSAGCRYVATPSSYHGPVPWKIVDATTGRELMYFDFALEGKKTEYEFISWNPGRDDILLRRGYFPSSGNEPKTELQVFDLRRKRVIESIPDSSSGASFGEVQWSRDGKWLILSRGQSLTFHAAPN